MIFKMKTARYVTNDNIIFKTELVIIALAGTFGLVLKFRSFWSPKVEVKVFQNFPWKQTTDSMWKAIVPGWTKEIARIYSLKVLD